MKYNEKLREYPHLHQEGAELKKTALWQLILQGGSDVLIDTLLREDSGIRDEDIALYVNLVLVTSEDFFFDQLYQKELPFEEVCEKTAFYMFTEKYQQDIENGGNCEQLPIRMETIMAQFAMSLRQMRKEEDKRTARLLEESEKLWNMKFVQMRSYHRVETDELKQQKANAGKELKECQENLKKTEAALLQTREQLKLMERKTGERISCTLPEQPGQKDVSDGKKKSLLERYREQKMQQDIMNERSRRRQRIEEWLRGDAFSDEQMVVVRRVCLSDLPLKSLEQICDPHLRVENMEALEAFLMKQEVVYVQGK